ncbi:MAG: hypothetical protein NVSMB32_04910 [Actinomycetota bacterium]
MLADAEHIEAYLVRQFNLLQQVAHPLGRAAALVRLPCPRRCRAGLGEAVHAYFHNGSFDGHRVLVPGYDCDQWFLIP